MLVNELPAKVGSQVDLLSQRIFKVFSCKNSLTKLLILVYELVVVKQRFFGIWVIHIGLGIKAKRNSILEPVAFSNSMHS